MAGAIGAKIVPQLPRIATATAKRGTTSLAQGGANLLAKAPKARISPVNISSSSVGKTFQNLHLGRLPEGVNLANIGTTVASATVKAGAFSAIAAGGSAISGELTGKSVTDNVGSLLSDLTSGIKASKESVASQLSEDFGIPPEVADKALDGAITYLEKHEGNAADIVSNAAYDGLQAAASGGGVQGGVATAALTVVSKLIANDLGSSIGAGSSTTEGIAISTFGDTATEFLKDVAGGKGNLASNVFSSLVTSFVDNASGEVATQGLDTFSKILSGEQQIAVDVGGPTIGGIPIALLDGRA
jgi:hypothetical protein